MKIILGKWVMVGAAVAILSACAGPGGNNVQVSPVASTTYPAVPAGACHVSSYPPKGKYVVIANLTITGQPGESATHLLHRLQAQGASMGATYVMVTSISDKTFLTPKNMEVDDNAYLSQIDSFNSTASDNSNSGTPTEVVSAQALKITSGSNKPNKALPSNVWQVNQTQNQ